MKTNDIEAVRSAFAPGRGERSQTNIVLQLCDEIEVLRRTSLLAWMERGIPWSARTFGPGRRTLGIIAHITKELREIEDKPLDLMEWVDVVILALDGAWRAGYTPAQIVAALHAKQAANFSRKWPAPKSEDEPVEHDRTGEAS